MNSLPNTSTVQIKLPRFALIFILGLLTMLMPLSIDMYLPSMPTIADDFSVTDGMVQLTISSYLLGFAFGQLLYGPLTDSFGRKPILMFGLIIFAIAAAFCGLAASIDQLITARFFHGIAAASTAVVVNALMRDIFSDRDEFSRMMSFVMLVSNLAPLLAPILGGFLLNWFNWHFIFYTLSMISGLAFILVVVLIPETLAKANRAKFSLLNIMRNFIAIFRHRQVLNYMLLGGFSGAGLFSFLSLGPFVYMNLYGIKSINFGYYFALNIVVLVVMNTINSRFVRQKGAINMLKLGLTIQAIMSVGLLVVTIFQLGFYPLIVCLAGYIGCMAIIGGNAMAITLSHYPYIAGTAASLSGTFRFVIAGLIGILLALFPYQSDSLAVASRMSEWLMVGSMVICNALACLFFLLSKPAKEESSQ